MQTIDLNEQSNASVHYVDTLEDCARGTVKLLSHGNVALSGGDTYTRLFRMWRSLAPDITSASFFPVDEGIVPFEDVHSNWGTAYKEFLLPLGKGEDAAHFASSLDRYSEILTNYFNNSEIVFDTIFLGVGDDGHTASLFPGERYLDDTTSVLLQTKGPKPPVDRITLAPKVLKTAKKIITIVAGENKRRVADQLLARNNNLPVVKVLSQRTDSAVYIERNLIT